MMNEVRLKQFWLIASRHDYRRNFPVLNENWARKFARDLSVEFGVDEDLVVHALFCGDDLMEILGEK